MQPCATLPSSIGYCHHTRTAPSSKGARCVRNRMFIEARAFCSGLEKYNYHECRWYKAEESFTRIVKKYRECFQCADFNAICSGYGQ